MCGLGLWTEKRVNNGMNGFEKTDEGYIYMSFE